MKRQRMDHIAGKRFAGRLHCGMVHKPVCVQEAMKIPEAKSAVHSLKSSVWRRRTEKQFTSRI